MNHDLLNDEQLDFAVGGKPAGGHGSALVAAPVVAVATAPAAATAWAGSATSSAASSAER